MSKEQAMEIINQLGGFGKLKAMVSADGFMYHRDWLSFSFKGNKKIDMIRIKLNAMDLYDINFYKFNKKNFELEDRAEYNGVYNDQLIEIFENTTGLYLRF